MRIIPCTIFRFYLFYSLDRVIFCKDHFLRDTVFHSTLIIVIKSHQTYSIYISLLIQNTPELFLEIQTHSYLQQDYNLNHVSVISIPHIYSYHVLPFNQN